LEEGPCRAPWARWAARGPALRSRPVPMGEARRVCRRMIAKHGSFSVATRRVRYCGTRPPPLMRPRPPGAAVALREKREGKPRPCRMSYDPCRRDIIYLYRLIPVERGSQSCAHNSVGTEEFVEGAAGGPLSVVIPRRSTASGVILHPNRRGAGRERNKEDACRRKLKQTRRHRASSQAVWKAGRCPQSWDGGQDRDARSGGGDPPHSRGC